MGQAHPHLRGEGEEGVCAAEKDNACLLGQHRGAHCRTGREQPGQPARAGVAHDAVEHHGQAERHQPIEQHLPADDHVVRHDREQQRGDGARRPVVQPRTQQVGDQDSDHADQSRDSPGPDVVDMAVHGQ
jgi:hypothetical protein